MVVSGVVIERPLVGLLFMIIVFLAQGSPLYQQFGFLTRTLTAADGVAVLVLGGHVLSSLRRGGGPNPPSSGRPKLILAVVAFFSWEVLSLAWSPAAVGQDTSFLRTAVEAVIVFGLTVLVLNDRDKARWGCAAYALTGVGLAIYTFLHFQSSGGFSGEQSTLVYRGGNLGSVNENELAIVLVLTPCFAYLATERLPRQVQLILTGLTVPPVGLASIILTSREAIIGVVVGLVVAIALARGVGNRMTAGALVIVAAGTFLAASATGHLPYYFQSRFSQAGYDQFGGRLPSWLAALQIFTQQPLIGLGALGFETVIAGYHINLYGTTSPHSDYIGTLANEGLIGFALLLVMLALLGRVIIFQSNRNAAAIAGFVILLVSMTTGSFLLAHWFWVAVSLLAAYGLTAEVAEPDPQTASVAIPRPATTSRLSQVPGS